MKKKKLVLGLAAILGFAILFGGCETDVPEDNTTTEESGDNGSAPTEKIDDENTDNDDSDEDDDDSTDNDGGDKSDKDSPDESGDKGSGSKDDTDKENSDSGNSDNNNSDKNDNSDTDNDGGDNSDSDNPAGDTGNTDADENDTPEVNPEPEPEPEPEPIPEPEPVPEPIPEAGDWDLAIPLSLGEKDGIAYVNSETGKFSFYTKSSARYVASGDLQNSGDFVYVVDATDASNSSAFFTVTHEGETTLDKPEVYNTPVDTSSTDETTDYSVAMESTSETIEYVKNVGKATYYDLEVGNAAGKDGITISVRNAPTISAIQYFIRNKTTGKVYTTYLGNGNVPTTYDFPFVNAGDEYQCYVAMTDAVNNTIMYNSKVETYKAINGKGEFVVDKKMNASDISVVNGILTVSNLQFPTAVRGATNAHLNLALSRGNDYNDKDYKWVDQRAIYDNGQTTYEWDYNKRMSNTNLKEIANKDCFIVVTYEFDLDDSHYTFNSIDKYCQLNFAYDESKLVAEYDAIPDEKGVKFIFNKKGNAEVTYFYVRGPNNGIEIESADVSNIAKNADGGIEVTYPFATADLEQTFTIYAQWSDGSALWKQPTKTAFGGWKTADELLNKNVWLNDTTITLSNGIEDGNNRLIKASCASGIAGIANDSAVKNPSISASIWGRRDGDSWFEKAGEYKITSTEELNALYTDGLSIFTDGFCTKSGMNSVATYKGSINHNKYSYRYIARYSFEIDNVEFTSAYGNYDGMVFSLPEKNGEFEYEPVGFEGLTIWEGNAQGNWSTPSVFIDGSLFTGKLDTSKTLRIYVDCIPPAGEEWEDIYLRSGSKLIWNSDLTVIDEDSGDKKDYIALKYWSNFVKIDGNEYYMDVSLSGEDQIVADILDSKLEIWSCNGTATTFTKVEVIDIE